MHEGRWQFDSTAADSDVAVEEDMMPDSAVEGENGMSLTKEVFTEPELLSQLFSPKDYET